VVLRCRAWGRCLRACCLIGIFSCQVGSICEGNAQHTSLACSEWAGLRRGSIWTKRGYEGRGEVYKSGVTLILRWASTPSGSTEPRLRGL
jgi:hypothetical protein